MGLLADHRSSLHRRGACVLGLVAAVSAAMAFATSASASVTSAQVLGWGANTWGQVGDGTYGSNTVKASPRPVKGLSGAASAVSSGYEFSLALLGSGTVEAWGRDFHGQLGNGTYNNIANPSPVPVSGLKHVTAISAGGYHALALLSNGTVMAWGDNEGGQLGNGTKTDSNVPVAVSGLSGVVTSISAGAFGSLALMSDGTVMEWGNFNVLPVAVSGLSEVAAIAQGAGPNLALLRDGTVMAWGENGWGELGNGTTTNSATPVAVCATGTVGPCPGGPYLSEVTAVSAGSFYSLALRRDGKVVAWGLNSTGVLGDGTMTGPETCFNNPCSRTPVEASGVSGATQVAAGGASFALLGNGTLMSWGGNSFGQLGIGSRTGTDVPVAVSGLTGIVGVSERGGDHPLAFRSPTPTVTKITPNSGPVTGETTVTITGANLSEASAVHFGSTAAGFSVNSATSIIATSPANPTGSVDITVTTPLGTSVISSNDHFKFLPTITSLSPNEGSTAGGTSVTVIGAGFALGKTATAFKFGSTKATSVNCNSTTECTVVAPAHPAGGVDVVATASKLTSAKNAPADQFTYS